MTLRSGQSCSADLRGRVLEAYDGGQPAATVASVFRVSLSYIYKALGRRRATGETSARSQSNQQKLKLVAHHEAIKAEVKRRPDATLAELRGWLLETHGIEASVGLMHKTMVRLGLTLKKAGPGRGTAA